MFYIYVNSQIFILFSGLKYIIIWCLICPRFGRWRCFNLPLVSFHNVLIILWMMIVFMTSIESFPPPENKYRKDKKGEEKRKNSFCTIQFAAFISNSISQWLFSYLNSGCIKSQCLMVLYYVCVGFVFTVKVKRTLRIGIESFTSLYPLMSLAFVWAYSDCLISFSTDFLSNKMLWLVLFQTSITKLSWHSQRQSYMTC